LSVDSQPSNKDEASTSASVLAGTFQSLSMNAIDEDEMSQPYYEDPLGDS
jgi:hypothetical protein